MSAHSPQTLPPWRTRLSRSGSRLVPAPLPEWAYFLDLDGTLIEIAAVPSGVHADGSVQLLIAQMVARTGGALAIITGRPIREIDALFPGLVLPVAGQHGVERRSASGEIVQHAVVTSSLDEARSVLTRIVGRHPVLLLEDKGMSLALHYRQAPRLGGYAHRTMSQVRRALGDAYCVQAGKFVVELKPAGRDKGSAITDFMAEWPFSGRMPVFIGDDLTDEYGFDVVNAMGGLSVKVGRGRTRAQWQMQDVNAVRGWLSQSSGRRIVEAIPSLTRPS